MCCWNSISDSNTDALLELILNWQAVQFIKRVVQDFMSEHTDTSTYNNDVRKHSSNFLVLLLHTTTVSP